MGKKRDWLIVHEEPLAGYSMQNIFRVLWDNKFRIHPKYWLRFGYGIGLSFITIPLKVWQKIRHHRKIKKTEIKEDPIFIIGHYRTGTTYLMTLMAFDKSKGYVSNIEGYATLFYLGVPKFARWRMEASLPEVRPMDNVVMGVEEPTEEEYCIGTFTRYGYYTGFIFPRNFDLYSKFLTFEGMPKDKAKWKKAYYYTVQMLTYGHKGKQLFLKNPTHSYRLPEILEMFPNAKFIHTYRNPYKEKMKQDILDNYKLLYEYQNKDLHLIPEDRIVHIKYEEFIQTPAETMEKVYKELNISGWEEYKDGMIKYAESQKREYVPNKHKIDSDTIRKVNENWKDYMEQYGYEKLEP
ncbi:MAG: sulfotransferase family protein [Candidatus Heimdallarchaeaceae archaeon]|jgi:hypothetical protein